MKKRRYILTAALTAACLTFTPASVSAYSDDMQEETAQRLIGLSSVLNIKHYQDKARNFFDSTLNTTADLYGALLQTYLNGSNANLSATFSLGDTGKALLRFHIQELANTDPGLYNFISSFDLDWIDEIRISDRTRVRGWETLHSLELELNGAHTVTIECYLDPDTWSFYFRIPAVSDSYLKTDFRTLFGEDVTEIAEWMDEAVRCLPDEEGMRDLLDDYGNYLFDNISVGNAPRSYRPTDDGILQIDGSRIAPSHLRSVIPYRIIQDDSSELYSKLYEDTRLRDLYSQWQERHGAVSYEESLDTLFEEIRSNFSYSKFPSHILCLDSDSGQAIGNGMIYGWTSIHYLEYEENGREYFYANYSDEATLSGSGTMEEGLLSGSYTIEIEETPYCTIRVEDFDTQALHSGIWNGRYILELDQFDFYELGSFANTEAVLTAAGSGEGQSLTFALTDEDDLIFSLTVEGSAGGDLTFPRKNETKYNTRIQDEQDILDYISSEDIDSFAENLLQAGADKTFTDTLRTWINLLRLELSE